MISTGVFGSISKVLLMLTLQFKIKKTKHIITFHFLDSNEIDCIDQLESTHSIDEKISLTKYVTFKVNKVQNYNFQTAHSLANYNCILLFVIALFCTAMYIRLYV